MIPSLHFVCIQLHFSLSLNIFTLAVGCWIIFVWYHSCLSLTILLSSLLPCARNFLCLYLLRCIWNGCISFHSLIQFRYKVFPRQFCGDEEEAEEKFCVQLYIRVYRSTSRWKCVHRVVQEMYYIHSFWANICGCSITLIIHNHTIQLKCFISLGKKRNLNAHTAGVNCFAWKFSRFFKKM